MKKRERERMDVQCLKESEREWMCGRAYLFRGNFEKRAQFGKGDVIVYFGRRKQVVFNHGTFKNSRTVRKHCHLVCLEARSKFLI